MWTNSEEEKLLAIKMIWAVIRRVKSIPSLQLLSLLWVSVGAEPASSSGTQVGAFLLLSLPLKDLTGNEETEGDLGWISLTIGETNNQLNVSVFAGFLVSQPYHLPGTQDVKCIFGVQIILKTALYSFTLPWFPRLCHSLALPHP